MGHWSTKVGQGALARLLHAQSQRISVQRLHSDAQGSPWGGLGTNDRMVIRRADFSLQTSPCVSATYQMMIESLLLS